MSFRLLILTPYESAEAFGEFQAGRLLLAVLQRRRVEVTLRHAWEPEGATTEADVVLGWHYRHTRGNHLFYCKAVEEAITTIGRPFVNSARFFNPRHSANLAAWAAAGLPCAAHQRFRRFTDVMLPYPLVLRLDGAHRGRHQHRVDTPEEAAALWARERSRSGRPLDLAAEFVDTRWPDGFFRKRRAYVVTTAEGGPATVIPAHHLRARDWRVHFERVEQRAAAFREHRDYLASPDPFAEVLSRAVEALGVPWAAIDYSPRPEGGCVLWEANRNPLMWGDPGYPSAQPRDADRRFVEAIVDHLAARAAPRHAP